ncbi:hypothetical protein JTE90_012012 [Oedothorax gibbosus]|uniref:RING-type domain-containing protein n=1 Tax=Oedothorax gibbosus TaxID=931172 RepID=A0AAV6U0T7_9ARAC|nr:hypothetical protein JTE90_012012 [Oedothorax gibbosus]
MGQRTSLPAESKIEFTEVSTEGGSIQIGSPTINVENITINLPASLFGAAEDDVSTELAEIVQMIAESQTDMDAEGLADLNEYEPENPDEEDEDEGVPGMSEEEIELLPTHINLEAPSSGDNKEVKMCSICRQNYSTGDELRVLPCMHAFHVNCIDPWLRISATCPDCSTKVDVNEE